MSIAHPQLIGTDEHVTHLVEPAASGASEHLQDLVTPQRNLASVPLVLRGRDGHRSQAKVNTGGQPHRGHDDSELACLGEGLNDSGAHRVAQTTVVIGHSGFEHLSQGFADEPFLGLGQLQRMRTGQLSGYVRGEFFGVGSSGGEEQHRPQSLGQGLGAQAWPVTADFRRQSPVEFVGEHLVQRDRADGVFNDFDGTPQTAQPVGYLLGVSHRATEEEELGLRWG